MAQGKELEYDYDAIEPGYYDEVFHRNAGVQSKWHQLKFRHVQRAMPEGYARHLDIGCGPGTFIGSLPQDAESIGTDLADPQIQFALREYKTDTHDFRCVKSGALPFEDGRFDTVTLIELIEHLEIEGVRSLLTEAKRVLKPGGKLIVTTPNYGSLWPVLELFVNRLSGVSYEDQHITFFRRKRLQALLGDLGYDRPTATTFQGAAPFAAALSWKLADWLQNIENPLLTRGMGFLLMGTGIKPN